MATVKSVKRDVEFTVTLNKGEMALIASLVGATPAENSRVENLWDVLQAAARNEGVDLWPGFFDIGATSDDINQLLNQD